MSSELGLIACLRAHGPEGDIKCLRQGRRINLGQLPTPRIYLYRSPVTILVFLPATAFLTSSPTPPLRDKQPPPFDSRKFDPRFHPCLVLAVAAAFEGFHHWEHDQRLIGECIDSQSARQSLKDVVTREVERLVNAADPKVEVDPVHLEELVNQATEEAFYLF